MPSGSSAQHGAGMGTPHLWGGCGRQGLSSGGASKGRGTCWPQETLVLGAQQCRQLPGQLRAALSFLKPFLVAETLD